MSDALKVQVQIALWGMTDHEAWEQAVIERDGKCWRCGNKDSAELMARQVGPKDRDGVFFVELGETICLPCFAGKTLAPTPKTVRMNVEVAGDQYEWLKEYVKMRGLSLSAWLRLQIAEKKEMSDG